MIFIYCKVGCCTPKRFIPPLLCH